MAGILPYSIQCIDGALGLNSLDDHSVKLIYGSPPYPNVSRNYGKWKSSEYIELMAPFIDAAIQKLTPSKPRANGVGYVRKEKKIEPNPLGALPWNIIYGSVSGRSTKHQAVQPEYLPEKYIKACTEEGDIVVDPWAGTGTTGACAIRLGRGFIGFDIIQEHVVMANLHLKEIYDSLNK